MIDPSIVRKRTRAAQARPAATHMSARARARNARSLAPTPDMPTALRSLIREGLDSGALAPKGQHRNV